MNDARTRALLVCPRCRAELLAADAAWTCAACRASYAVRGNVPELVPIEIEAALAGVGGDHGWARWREAQRGAGSARARRALIDRVRGAPATDDATLRGLLATIAPDARVVDVGAGDGRARSLLGPRVAYVGIDPAGHGPGVVHAVAEALPLRDRSVDAALCLHAFDDFVDGPHVLAEMARVLVARGTLVLVVDVVPAVVAHARGGRTLGARLTGSLRAASQVGLRGGVQLAAGALLDRDRVHTHYYTRTQLLSYLGVRFDVLDAREQDHGTHTTLHVLARKRASKILPMIR